MSSSNPIVHARRINRTWLVRGDLAGNAARYLDALESRDPARLLSVCERAIRAAQQASHEQRDPKPDFYAALFSRATPGERDDYLKDHAWTRQRAEELADEK